ncbi:MAG: hypothetical protein LBD78_07045 [Spirochaetaceae bacterium]|jgi:predicted ferric reductase|nr:hypothetical protein [Spirochaetaceae bacterium]
MKEYRPLRLALFIYDGIRLLLLIGFWAILLPFLGVDTAESGGIFPLLVYTAPNALFPLMTLFLWLRFSAYNPYITLYIAGKIVIVASGLGWLFFVLPGIDRDQIGRYISGLWVLFLIITDTLSVMGCFLLRNRLNRKDGKLPSSVPGDFTQIAAESVKQAGHVTSTHTAGTTVQSFRNGGL